MRLSALGEFGLIERIRDLADVKNQRILQSIGDDAALIAPRPGWNLILTTDALVEGVHFDLRYTSAESLGWKALAINVSDVAAMGGMPIGAVITVAFPEHWETDNVDALYQGMKRFSDEYHCPVIGGDTVKSNHDVFINAAVIGEVEDGRQALRSGANAGDLLCVTGTLGGARVGLEVLQSQSDPQNFQKSIKRFLWPMPKVAEARKLFNTIDVTSMIDISDGLVSEINHLCQASHLGCLIFERDIPVSDEVAHWARYKEKPTSEYVLESGEEYELLFTVDKDQFEQREITQSLSDNLDFTVIGEMTSEDEGLRIQNEKAIKSIVPKGWDHFKS